MASDGPPRRGDMGVFDTAWWQARYDVDPATGCWVWNRGLSGGYGWVTTRTYRGGAHRLAWLTLRGPVPDGLQIDHLCRNRACVNPDHLEPVSQATNIIRGVSPSAVNARKQWCIHGHPLRGDNVRVTPRGERECVTCARLRPRLRRKGRLVGHPRIRGRHPL